MQEWEGRKSARAQVVLLVGQTRRTNLKNAQPTLSAKGSQTTFGPRFIAPASTCGSEIPQSGTLEHGKSLGYLQSPGSHFGCHAKQLGDILMFDCAKWLIILVISLGDLQWQRS